VKVFLAIEREVKTQMEGLHGGVNGSKIKNIHEGGDEGGDASEHQRGAEGAEAGAR
jgi:hypothetical protein